MKIKTEWDLSFLYKNENDPRIEKDLKEIEHECTVFEKKYRTAEYISSSKKLLKALQDYENLRTVLRGHKPWWYFALRNKLNSDDNLAEGKAAKFDQRITDALNKVSFFQLTLAKIPKKQQKIFLKDNQIAPFWYQLIKIFKSAEYTLSEGEEQLSELLSQTSYTMWKDGQSRVLNTKAVLYKGEYIPLPKAVGIYSDLPKQERRDLYGKIVEVLKSCSDFASSEINAVYNYKKIMDIRRGYPQPYSETILAYENDEKTVDNLTSLVTRNFSISKRFYRLHAKLLGGGKILYADKNTQAGNIKKKFSFEDSVSIVRDVFNTIDPKYADLFDAFLEKGQIDVYPKKGKSGGAFCWGTSTNPTYILLNHAEDIRSVETLAHEMGHAIHDELSKSQPLRYQDVSIATAEVASTFFEQAVCAELEKHLSESERIVFLHNKIMGDISTIFRQIACFNFELELHKRIREKGMVSKEEIADLLVKHMRSYLGDAVLVTADDGYTFVSWSHIRNFFYVYSYAFGQLISRALFETWKKDPGYAKKIEEFLSAGSSMSPEDIFKSIGIDTTKPAFFEAGLKSIEKDIKKLEKLSNQHAV